jgi:hypothetical protein
MTIKINLSFFGYQFRRPKFFRIDNPAKPPKLLDRMHGALRVRHYSYRAEWTYLDRARRFILFHCKRHLAAWARPRSGHS